MNSTEPSSRREVIGRRVPQGTAGAFDFTYSVIEPAPGDRDRRRERRMRSRLREGTVAERRGNVIVDCRIRDLTRTGARLHLTTARPLPRSFLLKEAGSQRSFWATLVWQSGQDAGVRLVPHN